MGRDREARTRVNEHGITERVPNDGYNPDEWREVTELMREEAHRQGMTMKGAA